MERTEIAWRKLHGCQAFAISQQVFAIYINTIGQLVYSAKYSQHCCLGRLTACLGLFIISECRFTGSTDDSPVLLLLHDRGDVVTGEVN